MKALRTGSDSYRICGIRVVASAGMALVIVLGALPAAAGPTPAQTCEASKNKIAGKYLKCRELASAKTASGGLGDAGKCSDGFDLKWEAAEVKGAMSCPDDVASADAMEAYLSSLASRAAAAITGTTGVPDCGDGVLNQVGEQCDGSDLGTTTCASLGYGGGPLSCTAGCRLDASGCSPCPDGMLFSGGDCWVLSESDSSCTAACTSYGLNCNEAAVQSVGSSGTAVDCANMINLLDPSAAPYTPSDFDLTGCGDPANNSIGCVLQPFFDLVKRVTHSIPTTCDADNSGPGCFLGAAPQRACACDLP
jgi:hypothetical protein